jgi:hypothetical protein
MRYKFDRLFLITQFFILLVFLTLTLCNEVFDIPHLLFGDPATSAWQRKSEMNIEIIIFALVVLIEYLMVSNLLKRIKVLEGFIPICANCKKIRHQDNWEQMETYISRHSLAEFTHSICPDCMKKLYPEYSHTAPDKNKQKIKK